MNRFKLLRNDLLWTKAQCIAGNQMIGNAFPLSLKPNANAGSMQMPIHHPPDGVLLQKVGKGGTDSIRKQGRIMQHHRYILGGKLTGPVQGHSQPQQFPLVDFFILRT